MLAASICRLALQAFGEARAQTAASDGVTLLAPLLSWHSLPVPVPYSILL